MNKKNKNINNINEIVNNNLVNNNLNEILEKIKNELRPDSSILININEFIEKINAALKEENIKAICVPGGSIAKGTFLKNDFDVDLFVKFDYLYKDKNISDIFEIILKKLKSKKEIKYERTHGSRDYFQVKNKNKTKERFFYEIVPVLDVSEPNKAINVTDMSPLHVSWLKKNLKKGQEDEIRLTKKFCKATNVYGAESYIRGFSGHVIDILIIYYGSFLNLLKQSQKWKAPVIIDVEKHYKSKQEILFNMNQSKITGPMIIVDPILKSRNAASALSYEKFSIFKKKALSFLKKPSEKFFKEDINKTELKKKKNCVILNLKPEKGKKDIIGCKILKAFKFMKNELTKKGFKLKEANFYWKNKVLFYFVFKNIELPEKKIIIGPPLSMKESCIDFKKKYPNAFEKDNRLFAEIKIEKRNAVENIREIAEKEYFKEKVTLLKIETII